MQGTTPRKQESLRVLLESAFDTKETQIWDILVLELQVYFDIYKVEERHTVKHHKGTLRLRKDFS